MTSREWPSTTDETRASLQHLQAELARIDLLIQREILRWQLAGQDPGDGFRGLHISGEEACRLLDYLRSGCPGLTMPSPAFKSP